MPEVGGDAVGNVHHGVHAGALAEGDPLLHPRHREVMAAYQGLRRVPGVVGGARRCLQGGRSAANGTEKCLLGTRGAAGGTSRWTPEVILGRFCSWGYSGLYPHGHFSSDRALQDQLQTRGGVSQRPGDANEVAGAGRGTHQRLPVGALADNRHIYKQF